MATFRSFEDIEAWRAARQLTREVYRVTRGRPFSRDHGLRDQLRRASVSVMANVAEGLERKSPRDFVRFLRIARGSASEVRSHLYVALDAEYIDQNTFDRLGGEARRITALLNGLIRYLRTHTNDIR